MKYIYHFKNGQADGNQTMRNLLGGKGANLAEMAGHPSLKLPVPPGFTLTTEICQYYYENGQQYPKSLPQELNDALHRVEKTLGKRFGSDSNPLLFSVRSGARISMPGMMETVLNVGLTSKSIAGLIAHSKSEKFVYDAYRRLITMYADVVMEKSENLDTKEEIRVCLDRILEERKQSLGIKKDSDIPVDTLKELCTIYKKTIKEKLGKDFPDDPYQQLWGTITAVLKSWNGTRAVAYRRIENIRDDWGTAINVQSMVFGNLGNTSSTGVAFTRNPGNGKRNFYGEYLVNAQGEDVVAGIRTPSPINKFSKNDKNQDFQTFEEQFPKVYQELDSIQKRLEQHYHDMQDIEFTVENGQLFLLQCRNGKRNGLAAITMALDMVKEGLIDTKTAVMRVSVSQIEEMLHPVLDSSVEKKSRVLGKGLPAGPGGAVGRIVFTSDEAMRQTQLGEKVVLVRPETNPEDVEGMRVAEGILTSRGGMTSHAALVARGWGKCCIVGCSDLNIDVSRKILVIDDVQLKEGDIITLNGTSGIFYHADIPMIDGSDSNTQLLEFLSLCDKLKKLKIRTNAETLEDANKALYFGAEGIGLFRIEHMFYGNNSEKPLFELRKMVISSNENERQQALDNLFIYVKADILKTLSQMHDLPVTIRLMDPPLHEFIPTSETMIKKLTENLHISREIFDRRVQFLHEINPMMGHRGVRLGVTYPSITQMQVRAILEASVELHIKYPNRKFYPEIMIPVSIHVNELQHQKEVVKKVESEVKSKFDVDHIHYTFGTMIEIPRAAVTADEIAPVTDFFSFGTNDLTQLVFGFSRDDVGSFLPYYLEKGILSEDPFKSLDRHSVGVLMKIAIEKGRSVKKDLKIGICGEHGGDPSSIQFCQEVGMDYVSCSPFRVPIARLAAAQVAVSS